MTGPSNKAGGFTLVEMAVVMLIMGFLFTGLFSSISGWLENRRYSDTRQQMEAIEDALIGYAIANNGGLPAADSDEDGVADPGVGRGELPWKTLGLDKSSRFDAWQHPFVYHVDAAYRDIAPALPPDTVSGLRVVDLSGQSLTANNPEAPIFVLVSYGKNGAGDGDNGNANVVYTSNITMSGFDDEVRWFSRYLLLGKLVDAGIWPQ